MARVFEMSTVMPRCPSRIESLAVWVPPPVSSTYNLLLFVGTAEGTLLAYEPSPQAINQPVAAVSTASTSLLGISPARLMGRSTDSSSGSKAASFLTFRLRLSKKRFSRKGYPINDLRVVDKWGILLSLSDTQISYHSLNTDPILKEGKMLPTGKGCTALAINTQTDKMCVAVKRALVIFSWVADDGVGPVVFNVKSPQQMGKFVMEREISLHDSPQKLIWSDPAFVYVGTSREYISVSVDAHDTDSGRDAVRTGARRAAVMCALRTPPSEEAGGGETAGSSSWGGWKEGSSRHARARQKDREVLLVTDSRGSFRDTLGQPSREENTPLRSVRKANLTPEWKFGSSLSWSEAPVDVLCCQPYVVGLLPRRVEIHCAQSCSLLQTIPLPSGLHAATTVHSVNCGHHGLTFDASVDVKGRKLSRSGSREKDMEPGSGWGDATKVDGVSPERKSRERGASSGSISPSPAEERRAELSKRIRDSALVFVATDKSVHLLRMLPLQDQIREMLRGSDPLYHEALSVSFASLGPPWCGVPGPVAIGSGIERDDLMYTMANVHTQYGFALYAEGQYSAALVQFGQACQSGHLPLEWVLGLFRSTPLFLSPESRDELLGNLKALRSKGADAPQLILFKYPSEPPSLSGKRFSDAIGQFLLLYLLGQRKVLLSRMRRHRTDDAQGGVYGQAKAESKGPSSIDTGRKTARMGSTDSIEALLQGDDIPEALTQELTILDTVLLRAFVLVDAEMDTVTKKSTTDRTRRAELQKQKRRFLRGRNWCPVSECERLLLRYPEMWESLLWLYYGKSLHEKALAWMRKLGFDAGAGSDRDRNPYALKTADYLRQLGRDHARLVLEYSKWVLRATPTVGLRIFIHLPANVTPLAPSTVLSHLEAHDRDAATKATQGGYAPSARPLAISFLEYLINEKGTESSNFHNKLVLLYLETIMLLRACADSFSGGESQALLADVKALRARLLKFLESSEFYSPRELASRFKNTDLYNEYAVLLSRVGRHHEALQIFVNQLGTPQAAEDYCSRVYSPDAPARKDVYLSLLEAYLKPGDALRMGGSKPSAVGKSSNGRGHSGFDRSDERVVSLDGGARIDANRVERDVARAIQSDQVSVEAVDGELVVFVKPEFAVAAKAACSYRVVASSQTDPGALVASETSLQRALTMLRAHATQVDAKKALEKLPIDTPIERLQPYLEAVLRARSSEHRDSQVVKQLLKKEHLLVMQELAKMHQQHVVISREMQCANPNCQRRFQGDGAFVRYSSGQVVHYACWKANKNKDPVTGEELG